MNHKICSYIKSIIRIFGFTCLLIHTPLGILLLIIAELFGIIEEQFV